METLEIVESRAKVSIYLAGALVFVALALFLPARPGENWRVWCGIFFGLCALVFAVLLAKPRRLVLDTRGFTVAGGLARRPRSVQWTDVEGFFVLRQGRGGKHVAYNHRPDGGPIDPFATRRRLAGADGLVSGMWPGSIKKTVALLNEWHARALAASPPPA